MARQTWDPVTGKWIDVATPASAPLSQQAAPGAGYRQATPTTITPAPAPASYDAFEAFRQSNQTGTPESILRSAYKFTTGRDPDDAGLKAHLANPGGLTGGVRAIWDSDEAKAYREKNAYDFSDPATRGPAPVAPGTTPPPGTPAPVTAQVFQGFTPKYAMEGFAFDREQNTGKSAKDAFAYLSNLAPPPPIHDKAALGAWFKQNVEPGMNALGHKIISVDGDKFTFSNWQGTFTVDFGRGAGAEGGALAWQVDDQTAQMSNGAYVPLSSLPPNTTLVDPQTGQPSQAATPISSSIQYRRPYQGYDEYVQQPQDSI